MIKFKELAIADQMMRVVETEMDRIVQIAVPEDYDIIRLEKLAKVYATLMANHRENMKAGVFGKLSNKDLDDTVDAGNDGSDNPDPADDIF